MKKISVCKAQPITENRPIKGVIIEITDEITSEIISLKELQERFDFDATKLFEAMKENLPQGTRHSLSKLLLNDTANCYVGI